MKSTFDCVVIGAGVAGMTASVYLKRANLSMVMLEKSAPGGQINRTASVDNYPGFVHIDGPSLAMSMFDQTQQLGVEYRYGNVLELRKEENLWIIKTDQEEISCKTVVVASGRIPRELGLPNERPLTGRGVSWCALCDGTFYRDQIVAVVGGGNSAFEESLYLADLCKEVIIIHRRSEFKAAESLQEKVRSRSNIRFICNSVIKTLNETDEHLSSLTLKTPEGVMDVSVAALFIYIGNIPDTRFLRKLSLDLQDNYIVVDSSMHSSLPHLYACGDVVKKEVYQISTAVGEGATAAYAVLKDLK